MPRQFLIEIGLQSVQKAIKAITIGNKLSTTNQTVGELDILPARISTNRIDNLLGTTNNLC